MGGCKGGCGILFVSVGIGQRTDVGWSMTTATPPVQKPTPPRKLKRVSRLNTRDRITVSVMVGIPLALVVALVWIPTFQRDTTF